MLANVYGPNWDNENFFKKLFFSFPNLDTYQFILGGDFNCCLDPTLDRSSNKSSVPSKSAKVIKLFMEQYACQMPGSFLTQMLNSSLSFLLSMGLSPALIICLLITNYSPLSAYACTTPLSYQTTQQLLLTSLFMVDPCPGPPGVLTHFYKLTKC